MYPFKRNLKGNWKCIFCIFMQKKGRHCITITRVFSHLFAFMMYMALVSRFHLFTSIISRHIAALYIFFPLQCFDQSTVIIVTMFSKQINKRMQMNAHSGKAMNCNLSGFYWTYLSTCGVFLMLNHSVDIIYIEKYINSHRTKHFVLCVACLL